MQSGKVFQYARRRPSCSREKENIHENKQQALLNHCFFVRDQLNFSVIQKVELKNIQASQAFSSSPGKLIL